MARKGGNKKAPVVTPAAATPPQVFDGKPKPPPTATEVNSLQWLQDAFTNPAARLGFGTPSLLEGAGYVTKRLSNQYPLLVSLYREHWIARNIVDVIADDMMKNWVELKTQRKPEEIDRLTKSIRKTQTPARILEAIKWGRLFGGAVAVIAIDGHEREDLAEPLDLKEVDPGSYRGLLVFDRWSGVSPATKVCSDISRPLEFGLPEHYLIQPENGTPYTIHASRCLRFIGPALPRWELQAQSYWGLCYDNQTEILTKDRGFVKFPDLLPEDQVATRNSASEFEWQQPTAYITEAYEGAMCHFTSRSMDILVTPQHRMLASKACFNGDRREYVTSAQELMGEVNVHNNTRLPVTSQWTSDREHEGILFEKTNSRGVDVYLSGDDYCALLGAYLAEGSIRNAGGTEIAQNEGSKGFAAYKELFDRIPNTSYDGRRFTVWNKKLRDHFAQFGKAHEKYIPSEIKNLSVRQLSRLWRFYILGDGSLGKRVNHSGRGGAHEHNIRAITVSKRLSDDLVEVAQKLGYSMAVKAYPARAQSILKYESVDCRESYVMTVRYSDYMGVKPVAAYYRGDIHCVSVPNKIVYVRRNGKPAWCGNSEIEIMFEELKKRDNVSWAVANLMFRSNILVIKDDAIAQMVSGAGMSGAAATQAWAAYERLNHMMSNQGLVAVTTKGGLEQHQLSFAGMAEIEINVMLNISGAVGIPMARLFGRTASGLGQSNEGDERIYNDRVQQKQERDVSPQLDKLLPVICMSELGEVPDDLDHQWNPIQQPTPEERAELAKSKTDAVMVVFNGGVFGLKTALKELRQISEETGMFTNITDEMINGADDTPAAQKQADMEKQMAEMGGAEGPSAEPKAEPSGALKGEGKGKEADRKTGILQKMLAAMGVGGKKQGTVAEPKPTSGSGQDSGEAIRRLRVEPGDLTFRESHQARMAGVSQRFKDGIDLPLCVIRRAEGVEILDGHHRAILALQHNWHRLPAVEIQGDQYDKLKDLGFNDEEITWAMMEIGGAHVAALVEANEHHEDDPELIEQGRRVLEALNSGDSRQATDAHDHNKPPQLTKKTFNGFNVVIEYPAQSRRTLRDKAGKIVYTRWLQNDYGYLEGIDGEDGDELDVILGPKENAKQVFVIHMQDMGSDIKERENEDKVLLGFPTAEAAMNVFEHLYGPEFFGGMTEMTVREFRERSAKGLSLADSRRRV